MTLGEPALVISLLPSFERMAQLFDGREAAHPHELLFERANDSLATAVAF